jgi:Flp pilus assembly pilin Flp
VRKLLRRFYCDDTGVSAIEFALIAAFILVPLVLGATELGYRTWAKHQFENAAQAGMDYGMYKRCNAQGCGFTATDIQNAVHNYSTRFGPNVTVAPAPGCNTDYSCFGCPGVSGVTLTTTQTTCGDGAISGKYVGLTATYNYTPLFQACGDFLPSGLCSSAPITWTVTAVARVY